MSADLGIIFELQWKKKPGGHNREDVASIGIWDTPDSSLDWMTFKSYVCQNLGTTEDIYVAYIDSDGDELPIESECEFQEALKFARQRANKGKEVILKVDKRGCQLFTPPSTSTEQKHKTTSASKTTDLEKDIKKKQSKLNSKTVTKTKSGEKIRVSMSQSTHTNGAEEKKSKSDDLSSISHELGKKLACIMKLEPEKRKKAKVDKDKDDTPPPWFKKYMQKFKGEIVAEVTANLMFNTRQMMEIAKLNTQSKCSHCSDRNGGSATASKPKKKKSSDDESSDCALSSDQRDQKLLKKIEKLHKREKKLEKKLDSKLEKLENKTKRRMEKKIQSKSCSEQPSEKKVTYTISRKRPSEIPVYLMDAIPLNDGPKPAEVHIKLGESYTKVWEIINNGTLPWTDKTELRLAWGTSGLEPEATVLKCPILMPGEKGEVAVTFRAPEFPGTFESYWHFYHMGDRFGHWLGCAVIVDSKEPEKSTKDAIDISFCNKDSVDAVGDGEECKSKIDQPVDLRMKCESEKTMDSSTPKPSVDDTYESLNEHKKCADTTESEHVKMNTEYESDSDDENLSVISGTISLSSDSEEDENFVVVPMPACFTCDVPLEKTDNVPNDSEENVKDVGVADVVTTLNETLDDIKQDKPPSRTNVNKTDSDHNTDSELKNENYAFDGPSINREIHSDEAECVANSKNVYAVDVNGHCIPVNFIWGNAKNKKKRSSGTQDVPKDDSKSSSKQEKKEGFKRRYSNESSFRCHTHSSAGPFCMSFQTGQQGNGKRQTSGTAFSRANSTSSNGFHHSRASSMSSSNASSSHTTHDHTSGAAVHILPETLVNGAINVASQAITTARAVFNNLRSNRPSEEFGDWHWTESAAETDRSTTESLKILLEMGFTNKILNVLLLQRYNNDIEKVVSELLIYKDNPGVIYNRQTQKGEFN